MKQQNLFEPEPAPWEADEAEDRAFATVVLSETPYGPYDYLIPEGLRARLEPGKRVRVPLGQGNRTVVGYCVKTRVPGAGDEAAEVKRRWKEIKSVVDAQPLLTPAMLRLTEWMADYYLCPWGQVLEAVVPTGVRMQAGTRKVALLSVPAEVAARLDELQLPPRQAEILRALAASAERVPLPELLSRMKCTSSPIRALQRKGLIKSETGRVYQRAPQEPQFTRQDGLQLNADQQRAMDAILAAINGRRFETLLVHGVTGSGKTELYMQAIEQVIHFGRQAIVLVPEISLTPQTVSRFRSRFPHVAVLHSHLSPPERNWHWQQIAAGKVQVVVGARSAVFAPTPHLGLIVLDEEHDASFKQDIVPRYHARDVALQRAQMENIPVVLGSATPSIESWYRAHEGDYRLVELPRRILDLPLPDVSLIDLRTDARSRSTRGAISRPLHNAMHQALAEGGQVILLLNRRGYSTTIQCPACGLVVMCPDCEMALTHHRTEEIAACHYCDYQIPAPPACPECAFEGIRYSGFGTEKLEAEVKRRFPDANCLRMDSDSMRAPGSHERAFQQFRDGEIQILVGTQMIAKGLDFPNVTLVGVINADVALHFPDFRASERTFQLVTQVAGRTGRGPRGGRVLVQTYSPDHPAITAAVHHDYDRFAQGEIPVRREHGYPPFTGLIRLIVRGPVEEAVEQFAHDLTARLRAAAASRQLEPRILGPAPAPMAKLRGKFRYHLLVMSADAAALRAVVRSATQDLKAPDEVLWIADVDPVDML